MALTKRQKYLLKLKRPLTMTERWELDDDPFDLLGEHYFYRRIDGSFASHRIDEEDTMTVNPNVTEEFVFRYLDRVPTEYGWYNARTKEFLGTKVPYAGRKLKRPVLSKYWPT